MIDCRSCRLAVVPLKSHQLQPTLPPLAAWRRYNSLITALAQGEFPPLLALFASGFAHLCHASTQ